MKANFGHARLLREGVSFPRRVFFRLGGVAADHKLRFMLLRKFLRNRIPETECVRILDAGCGSGDYSFYFADRYPSSSVLGVDISEENVRLCKRILETIGPKSLEFRTTNLATLDVADEYDLICCVDVLQYINDQPRVIAAFHRALKAGGLLFMHIPLARVRPVLLHRCLEGSPAWTSDRHAAERHTKDSFLSLVRGCGFEVEHVQSTFNHYLGEFAVSLMMLHYEATLPNKIMLALLTPITKALVYLDAAIEDKSGNAVAVLLRKPAEG